MVADVICAKPSASAVIVIVRVMTNQSERGYMQSEFCCGY
jgi:hypothetical protein